MRHESQILDVGFKDQTEKYSSRDYEADKKNILQPSDLGFESGKTYSIILKREEVNSKTLKFNYDDMEIETIIEDSKQGKTYSYVLKIYGYRDDGTPILRAKVKIDEQLKKDLKVSAENPLTN